MLYVTPPDRQPPPPKTEDWQHYAAENTSLVYWYVQNHYPNNLPEVEEDMVSVGMLALVKAARYFQPKLGNEFSTYATTCIAKEISRWWGRQWRNCRGVPKPKALHLSAYEAMTSPEEAEAVLGRTETAFDTCDDAEELEVWSHRLRLRVERLMGDPALSELEKKAIRMRLLEGRSVKETATELKRPERWVKVAVGVGRRRIGAMEV